MSIARPEPSASSPRPHRRATAALTLLAGLVTTALLAACGTAVAPQPGDQPPATGGGSPGSSGDGGPVGGSGPPPGTGLESQINQPECPAGAAQPVPQDHSSVTAAHVCKIDSRTMANGDVWTVVVVQSVTGGLDTLLTSYARRDTSPPPSGDVACPAIAYNSHPVWLTVSGRTFSITEPLVGPCRTPDPAALVAYQALTLAPVREVPLQLASTALAQRTGCAMTVKDLLAMAAPLQNRVPASGLPRPVSASEGAPVTACTYTHVGKVPSVSSSGDLQDVEGTLTAGRALTTAEVARINAALAGVTPVGDCDLTASSPFVVLVAPTSWTQVALTGCAVVQDDQFWRAPPALRTALATIG